MLGRNVANTKSAYDKRSPAAARPRESKHVKDGRLADLYDPTDRVLRPWFSDRESFDVQN